MESILPQLIDRLRVVMSHTADQDMYFLTCVVGFSSDHATE